VNTLTGNTIFGNALFTGNTMYTNPIILGNTSLKGNNSILFNNYSTNYNVFSIYQNDFQGNNSLSLGRSGNDDLVINGNGSVSINGNAFLGKNLSLYGCVYLGGLTNIDTNYGNALNVNGEIYASGKITTGSYFNVESDYRIKKNVHPMHQTVTVDNLQPIKYELIYDGIPQFGFIAHEVQQEYPFLVSGEKDGKDPQSLNYTGLIPILVKEVKDLKEKYKRIEEENRRLTQIVTDIMERLG
jgi:hypothetical protein